MASRQEHSPWLELVQRFERAIGQPVESFVRSDEYFDLMTQINRARTRLTRGWEEMAEQWLHLFNLPAATDVRRLREQLSRVEREVNRIAKALADLEEAREAPPAARPAAKRKPKPRRAASAAGKTSTPRGGAMMGTRAKRTPPPSE